MPRQAFVDERVVRVEELQHAAVLIADRLEEELCLREHRRSQRFVEVGEQGRVGREVLELARLQPLAGEVFGKARALGSRSIRLT